MKKLFLLFLIIPFLWVSCSTDDNSPKGDKIEVTLNKTTLLLGTGGTEQLIATIAPADATNKTVTWTSSAAAVATVNATDGTVTAVAVGTATITATTADGNKTATCAVTVTAVSPNDRGVVEGTIAGVPAGTTVILYVSNSSATKAVGAGYTQVATTTTDASGKYRFENLPAGTYVVDVVMPGCTSTPSRDIILTSSGTANGIDFTLNSADNTIKPTGNGVTAAEIAETPLTRLYPNPTEGAVTLEFETATTRHITVSDMAGKTLARQTANDQTVVVDMSSYPAGVYLITIDEGKDKRSVRVVKN
jgi:hypothetical protein